MALVAGLLADFDRYLAQGDADLVHDGATYRMAGMWLDDREFAELLRDSSGSCSPGWRTRPKRGAADASSLWSCSRAIPRPDLLRVTTSPFWDRQ